MDQSISPVEIPAPTSDPVTDVDTATNAVDSSSSETLRRALDFIHAHAHEEVTAARIANAACVTTRAVQLAFQRHLGTTPSAYLRKVRLDRAHRDLMAASGTEPCTVTQVATRWGFHHQGRFAAYYRQAFGQNPRQTLAR